MSVHKFIFSPKVCKHSCEFFRFIQVEATQNEFWGVFQKIGCPWTQGDHWVWKIKFPHFWLVQANPQRNLCDFHLDDSLVLHYLVVEVPGQIFGFLGRTTGPNPLQAKITDTLDREEKTGARPWKMMEVRALIDHVDPLGNYHYLHSSHSFKGPSRRIRREATLANLTTRFADSA